MAVFADGVVGTIGGGHLEFQAIDEARRRLAGAPGELVRQDPLGPSLGQCCGGVVNLRFERVGAADIPALEKRLSPQLSPLALFGGGHVGAALARLLSTLPFKVRWIDSRDGVFPDALPAQIETEHSDPVQDAVAQLEPGSRVLIMSFSSVGVPGGGVAFRTMPAYLAAGLPIEGVVILEAVDAIPDVFKTITNVTGDMSAAAILSRQPVAPAA